MTDAEMKEAVEAVFEQSIRPALASHGASQVVNVENGVVFVGAGRLQRLPRCAYDQ